MIGMNVLLGFGLAWGCAFAIYAVLFRGGLAKIAIRGQTEMMESAHVTSARLVKLIYPSDTQEGQKFQIVIGHPVVGTNGTKLIADGM